MSIKENISKKIHLSVDGRSIRELSRNLKKAVKILFPNIKDEDIIKCHIKSLTKTQLTIECCGECRNIAILNKRFSKRERVFDFINFLRSIDVSFEAINALLMYHFSYGNEDLCGVNLSCFYHDKIKTVEEEFKDKNKLKKVIERIFIGEDECGKVDCFYFGDERLGVIINKEKFIKKVLNHKDNYTHNYMRIGAFNILPISRLAHQNDVLKNVFLLKLNIASIIKK